MNKINKTENPSMSTEKEAKNRAEMSDMSRRKKKLSGSEKKDSPNRLWSIVPGLVILLLALVYMIFDRNYIQCVGIENKSVCQNLEGNLISKVDYPMNLSNANLKITNANNRISESKNLTGNLTNEIYETRSSYTNTLKGIGNAIKANDNANIKQLTNQKRNLNEVLDAQESQLESLTEKKEAAETELISVYNQLSARYANRMLWVFLTGISLVLSVAAIVITFFAIYYSLNAVGKNKLPKLNANIIPLGFIAITGGVAFFFALIAYENKESYMSVVLPMYNQSIIHEGSVLIDSINLSNVIGFAATIFLVVASCSILYKVQATAGTNTLNDSKKASAYEKSKKHLQAILYVGAAMLVVGILRVSVLSEWHLSFVSSAQENAYINSLRSYFTSSLSVQAGFYSILLAVIYFPTAYWIRENVAALKLEVEETNEKGLSFTLTDFIPKLISVFSPILAAPLAAFIGYFFGGE